MQQQQQGGAVYAGNENVLIAPLPPPSARAAQLFSVPLLVTAAIPSLSATSRLSHTLCFILAMSVTGECRGSFRHNCPRSLSSLRRSGPLLAFQALRGERRAATKVRPDMATIDALPRPSFASSLWSSRSCKASQGCIAHQECPPVSGDGFETINGYDYPFSPDLPGSYHASVKSVPYASHHWASASVVGDRVNAPKGLFSRVINMMSPKPKLQVLMHKDGRNSLERTMPGHYTIHMGEDYKREYGAQSEMELQDVSQTSAAIPQGFGKEDAASKVLQDRARRVDTIYEVDTPRSVSVADEAACHAR